MRHRPLVAVWELSRSSVRRRGSSNEPVAHVSPLQEVVMHRALGLLAIPFLAVACQHAGAGDNDKKKLPDRIRLDEHAALLEPIQVASLTLTPIVATEASAPKPDPDVLTLDEAFAKKLVGINEQAGGSSVNNLTLTNNDQRPLF